MVQLGTKDETVEVGDHIAYVWETPTEFIEAVGFLQRGIRDGDHCVIFGHDDANAEVVRVLREMGAERRKRPDRVTSDQV